MLLIPFVRIGHPDSVKELVIVVDLDGHRLLPALFLPFLCLQKPGIPFVGFSADLGSFPGVDILAPVAVKGGIDQNADASRGNRSIKGNSPGRVLICRFRILIGGENIVSADAGQGGGGVVKSLCKQLRHVDFYRVLPVFPIFPPPVF